MSKIVNGINSGAANAGKDVQAKIINVANNVVTVKVGDVIDGKTVIKIKNGTVFVIKNDEFMGEIVFAYKNGGWSLIGSRKRLEKSRRDLFGAPQTGKTVKPSGRRAKRTGRKAAGEIKTHAPRSRKTAAGETTVRAGEAPKTKTREVEIKKIKVPKPPIK